MTVTLLSPSSTMLEIEMRSPSLRTRTISTKRSRSPDSPTERPAKRLSLAAGRENAYFYETRSSASSSRQSSEDWVKQAGGLSIESPHLLENEQSTSDDSMAVDSEEQYIPNHHVFLSSVPPQPQATSHYNPHHPQIMPSITVQPATPQSRTQTRESPTPMQVSSPPHFGSPTKRPNRFTMGPRANCEKCRLGVKGHWAHWD